MEFFFQKNPILYQIFVLIGHIFMLRYCVYLIRRLLTNKVQNIEGFKDFSKVILKHQKD